MTAAVNGDSLCNVYVAKHSLLPPRVKLVSMWATYRQSGRKVTQLQKYITERVTLFSNRMVIIVLGRTVTPAPPNG